MKWRCPFKVRPRRVLGCHPVERTVMVKLLPLLEW